MAVAVAAAAALLILPPPVTHTLPAVEAQGPGLMGDVDCGGTVDSVDALKILRLTAGLPTNAACMQAAGDVDCDGDKDAVDALKILRHVAGLSNTPAQGCTPIGDPLGPPPSSDDLIDQALAEGKIDSETALIYHVYATFGDDRLPPQYRGDDSGGPPDGGVPIVQSMLDSVSPQARSLLQPFLIPPVYEDSWMGAQAAGAPAGDGHGLSTCSVAPDGWDCRDASVADVRVWWQTQYPQDEAQAEAIATAMDSSIWPPLTALMGQPLSDAGSPYDGGDGRVDIYLVDTTRSMAIDHPNPGCEKTPAYINLKRGESLSTLAHEFMHVLQWGFDVAQGCVYQAGGGYNWLGEATAQWAADYVYPAVNWEHPTAAWYMGAPGLPLETADDAHEYGAYLFFQYLTKFYDSEQIVRTIWNKAAQYGSLQAINEAIPGGFEERWPAFAACLWNAPPSDCFAQWDGLTQTLADSITAEDVDMGAATLNRSLELTVSVEHMAANYRRFTFTDDRIKGVTFKNTLVGASHAAVQALAKVDGQWQGPLDWTDREVSSFCRDSSGHLVEELVLIFSNSDWAAKSNLVPSEPPVLTVSTGCASVTLTWDQTVADVGVDVWVLPEAASNLDEVRAQQGQPGFDCGGGCGLGWYGASGECDTPPVVEWSEAIEGVTADAQYIAVYYWGYCVRDPNNYPDPPATVPITITIQYPDGRVETETADLAGSLFALFGPYDFGP